MLCHLCLLESQRLMNSHVYGCLLIARDEFFNLAYKKKFLPTEVNNGSCFVQMGRIVLKQCEKSLCAETISK